MTWRRVAALRTAHDFRQHLAEIGVELPFDPEMQLGPNAPLAEPYRLQDGFTIGNRWCVQPMEGWDGTADGRPTELTRRRWTHFGQSGAKLIWGGEAVAVRHDGRANPRQLLINEANLPDLAALYQMLVEAHEARFGSSRDLLVGLQLTHSGRFARPNRHDQLEPAIAYHHPLLDMKFGLAADHPLLTDTEIEVLVQEFGDAAELAAAAGFAFVDIKHCHGYLGHEFLTAHTRPGPYGGSFENRTRFLQEVVGGIRRRVPELRLGVRLSAFDMPPFEGSADNGVGSPASIDYDYPFAFGCDPAQPLRYALDEARRFLALLEALGVELVNLTAGSPYYTPHIQRPALFAPSDGYPPPEDPLVGVARQIEVTAQLKQAFPKLLIVGSAYSYLQNWLPNVAQHNVRTRRVDFVGLGRIMLPYPDLPADVLAGKKLDPRRICRTFSDCTTAPRHGLVSGCYPLDAFYKARPEATHLAAIKAAAKIKGGRLIA
jgi:NADPH2 dehydrogenase